MRTLPGGRSRNLGCSWSVEMEGEKQSRQWVVIGTRVLGSIQNKQSGLDL